MSAVSAIVVAAGEGERFGGLKQLAELGGKTALEWSVTAATQACDQVVVVLPQRLLESEDAAAVGILKGLGADVAAGGNSRIESVQAGLERVRPDAGVLVVHDAVRPGASADLFKAVIATVRNGAEAAVPVLEIFDTVKQVEQANSQVLRTVDRNELVLTQTPQAFSRQALLRAHNKFHEQSTDQAALATDDAALVEASGGKVVTVPGERSAQKITTRSDLVEVQAMMAEAKSSATPAPSPHSGAAANSANSAPGRQAELRIGHGYDAHRRLDDIEREANPNRKLVLGGVVFPDEVPLAGHSDADVVCHAVIDAMLNAAGLGDIGEHFPDTDPNHAGANSIELLRQTAHLVGQQHWRLLNADCTVVADRPLLAAHKPQMQELLSTAAGGPVTVSGKRTEGLGALGRGEGIVSFAVALLERSQAAPSG